MIRRVGIPIAFDAVTAQTGVRERLSAIDVALGEGRRRENRAKRDQRRKDNSEFRLHKQLIIIGFVIYSHKTGAIEGAMVVSVGGKFQT